MARQSDRHTRLRRVRRLLKKHTCSHVLVSDTTDVRAISGFVSTNAYLVISRETNLLCTDFRYEYAARAFCRREAAWDLCIIRQGDFSFLQSLIPDGATLGIQSEHLTLDDFERLEKALPKVSFVRLGSAVSEVSIAKTPDEIAAMARCARIGSRALREIMGELQVGMTEREARDVLEQRCRELGSEGPAFDTIVLFGRRSALPHGVPGAARLKPGDFVLLDFGCTFKGVRSDMTRTLVKGRASAEQRRIYAIVRRAQMAARRAVRAGVRAAQVDRCARQVIADEGYGDAFGHGTGHGVGYRIHEAPRIGTRSSVRLRTDSVVTVEPGIYIRSVGGVRIEDMVQVTVDGARLLTGFPRGLIEV